LAQLIVVGYFLLLLLLLLLLLQHILLYPFELQQLQLQAFLLAVVDAPCARLAARLSQV
jgi:hypothetical protein